MYGKEISDRINELHYNVKELASDIGISTVEMYRIKNDERNLINKETFLNLMKYLKLEPASFGGFVRLDFKNKDDFYDGISFLTNIKEMLLNEPDIKAKNLASYLSISEALLSKLLSFEKTTIPIDRFYLLCKFFNLNWRNYLVDKNIYPSKEYISPNDTITLEQSDKLNELISIANNLSSYEINKLINYANYLSNDKTKRRIKNK